MIRRTRSAQTAKAPEVGKRNQARAEAGRGAGAGAGTDSGTAAEIGVRTRRRGRSSERGAQPVESGRHLVHEFVSIGSGESRALSYTYKFWDFVPSGFAGRPSLELWKSEV